MLLRRFLSDEGGFRFCLYKAIEMLWICDNEIVPFMCDIRVFVCEYSKAGKIKKDDKKGAMQDKGRNYYSATKAATESAKISVEQKSLKLWNSMDMRSQKK